MRRSFKFLLRPTVSQAQALAACLEDHRQLYMTKRPASRPLADGSFAPNGAAAKAGLNKSILDAGWGVFLRVLAGKAESAGRVLIPVNPANTSRTCPACGHCAKDNRPTQATFQCTRCNHTANADVVAALNILKRAGLVLPAVA